jgi:hypothetical protein
MLSDRLNASASQIKEEGRDKTLFFAKTGYGACRRIVLADPTRISPAPP